MADAMKPVRIQRKRTKGYNMQVESMALNGFPVVYVGRPTKWGNPYKVIGWMTAELAILCYQVALLEVKNFGEAIPPKPWANKIIADLGELRGKNLACWCKLTDDCHADVLWELINREITP